MKRMPMMGKQCKRVIKSFDIYGVPVSLTYKSHGEIKSMVGGVATLLARFSLLLFLVFKCQGVIQRNYTI